MSTILDVARLAQVSTATVSRVINSPETVRESTRKKVLRAMKMCNYKYNALARGFVTKKSNTIGLIIPNINNPVFAESTLGVQEYANSKNIKVILGNTSYDAEQEQSVIKALRESQVDGLIITSTDPKGKLIKSLTEENVPIVLLFSTIKPGPISAVGVDNYRGGYEATEHLISLGHRRIGMVSGNFAISDRAHHRWHGYRQCLKDNNIPYDSQLLIQTEYSLEGGRDSIGKLLQLDAPPSAVFCSNDYLALGAIKGAMQAGLTLPEDLSIVGFDDMPTASYMIPALTTINQPAYEMGRTACEILLQIMEDPTLVMQHMMETKLVVRESTAAIANDAAAGDNMDRQ
ncbi:LacI family DNA-binding transcriptional regulator [Maridesulfovibrio sp.]|uniref:LacI family DNA-binding transcriptional regulator n=1 Tax=Maridesulfovibrio sp. TaxID=2795000 RepID=UPI003B009235